MIKHLVRKSREKGYRARGKGRSWEKQPLPQKGRCILTQWLGTSADDSHEKTCLESGREGWRLVHRETRRVPARKEAVWF